MTWENADPMISERAFENKVEIARNLSPPPDRSRGNQRTLDSLLSKGSKKTSLVGKGGFETPLAVFRLGLHTSVWEAPWVPGLAK